jgi:hypothetical protein
MGSDSDVLSGLQTGIRDQDVPVDDRGRFLPLQRNQTQPKAEEPG